MNGYTGKILFVDLTQEKIVERETMKYMEFLGGRGIATKIIYAFGRDTLVFMTGPLTGFISSGSRMDVVSFRNMLVGSNVGGEFPTFLKFAGYDGMVIIGRSEKPAILQIDDDGVSLDSGEDLWGKDAFETIDLLTHGQRDIKVAVIGRGGEKGIKTAGIMFSHRNLASRGGLGAIMGGKNLKAIVVHTTKGLEPYNPPELMKVITDIQRSITKSGEFMRFKDWHVNFVPTVLKLKMPYFGDYERVWEDAEKAAINAREFFEERTSKRASCFSCPLRCWAIVNYEGEYPINLCQGTFPAIVFTLKVKDPKLAWKIYLKMQREGLDIMSTVAVIAYASRLGKVKLGSEEILDFIDKIVNRVGEGNIFAEGIKKAAEYYGVPAVYVKGGMESWSSDIRPFVGSALISTVADSGGVNRALYGFPEFYYYIKKEQAEKMAEMFVGEKNAAYPWDYSDAKVKFTVMWENMHIIADSLGVCVIALLTTPLELWCRAYYAITGNRIKPSDLIHYAEKIRTLERIVNIEYAGIKDEISPRLFKGEVRLDREKLERIKKKYYELRGWNENGIPMDEILKKYDLR